MWWNRYGTNANAMPATHAAGALPVSVRARRNAPLVLGERERVAIRKENVRVEKMERS